MNTETEQAIAAAVAHEIATTPAYRFDLVYIDYRDAFDQDSVDALARGDWEKLDEIHDEWISESQHRGAHELLTELVGYCEDGDDAWDAGVLHEWMHTESGYDALIDIMERDTSTPLKDIAHNSGNVLLRVTAIDEDDCWSFEEIEPIELLDKLGLPHTENNLGLAASIIDNASPEYSVCMGSWLLAVNVSDLYDLGYDYQGKLRVTGMHLWLGNPFSGSGWADGPFDGEIILNREDLRTDHDAFGYSWTDVVGGTNPSYYEAKIEPITEEVNA